MICIWTLLKHLTPFHTIGTTIVLVWYHKNYLSVDLIFSHSAHQRVVINSTFSNLTAVTSGVSQGTVLGPTLFIIFINNIHYSKIIATFCWWYKQVSSVNDADCLQSDLQSLRCWDEKWLLKFNISKWYVLKINKATKVHIKWSKTINFTT